MTDKPTDEALENLFVEETGFDIDDFPTAIFGFTRAALTKWGQPAQAAEPVAWLRNTTDPQPHAVTNLKYRSAADTDAGIEYIPVFAAPQPVEREPLTDEQTKALMQARRTAMLMTCKARVPECGEFSAIAQDLDWLCESLGIKGGQHGTE